MGIQLNSGVGPSRQSVDSAEAPAKPPRVCVQVLACGAAPAALARTLDCLRRLHFLDFEVQVLVDGRLTGTQCCRDLPPRFHVVAVGGWPQPRAGVLNEATSRLAPEVELVALVEAGQAVRRDFLALLTPRFEDGRVAFVYTRTGFGRGLVRRLLGASWKVVDLASGEKSRETGRCGAMQMVRVEALRQIGGWAVTVADDESEASLRFLVRGYLAVSG